MKEDFSPHISIKITYYNRLNVESDVKISYLLFSKILNKLQSSNNAPLLIFFFWKNFFLVKNMIFMSTLVYYFYIVLFKLNK